MKIFIHKFFNDLDLTPFIKLFEMIYNEKIELGSFYNSEILFECLFGGQTVLYRKKWLHSYLLIGESDKNLFNYLPNGIDNNIIKDYSCVLKGEKDNKNIINFPLYILYSYAYNFSYKFKQLNYKLTKIPPKDICVIISNGSSNERKLFLEKLEEKFQIDYAGNYKNNVPRIKDIYCTPKFIEFVSQYKIIITMENTKNKDYITEKILHGFGANIIPVYWGSDNINEYFNEERFINVKSLEENDINKTIEQIDTLLNNNEKYLEMVNKPIYNNNEIQLTLYDISRNIKKLLNIDNKQHINLITYDNKNNNIKIFNEIKILTHINLKTCITHIRKSELEKINMNDIIIYYNSESEYKIDERKIIEYVDLLNSNKENIGLITFNIPHKIACIKNEILDNLDCNEKEKEMLQSSIDIIIIKKNYHSLNIINTWYDICNNYYNLVNNNNVNQEIFSILANRYKSYKFHLRI